MRNLASSTTLCKTSIMASFDIFNAFGENLLESASDSFSQLLLQLLLKASQENKFVCEETHRLCWEFMWNWLFVGLLGSGCGGSLELLAEFGEMADVFLVWFRIGRAVGDFCQLF